jgi:hypothetical protein
MATKSKVLVTGDFVIDHHILKGNKSEASSKSGIGTFQIYTYGGAKLTYDLSAGFVNLIQQFIQDEEKAKNADKTKEEPKFLEFEYIWPFIVKPVASPNNGTVHDSYIRWQITEKDKKGEKEQICSLSEKLGFGIQMDNDTKDWFEVIDNHKAQEFDTIVIDEAGIGFRNHPEAWPNFEKANNIILKTTYPLCDGKLWDELMKHKNKLTTIVNLNQINHYNIKVSKSISWEQTALDIVYGLYNNKTLKDLLNSNAVIVTIGSAGAVIVEKNGKSRALEYSLVYDPANMEGEWEAHFSEKIINGIGLGCSFLVGFTASKSIKSLKIHENVIAGLKTMTVAMLDGVFKFKELKFEPSDLSLSIQSPLEERKYYSAFIPDPEWFKMDEDKFSYLNNSDWSILENNYDNRKNGYTQKSDLFPLAFDLALNGIDSIQYAPRLTLGKVTLFDRNEIENLRNIRTQIDFYDRYEDGKKPLNITVFGPLERESHLL